MKLLLAFGAFCLTSTGALALEVAKPAGGTIYVQVLAQTEHQAQLVAQATEVRYTPAGYRLVSDATTPLQHQAELTAHATQGVWITDRYTAVVEAEQRLEHAAQLVHAATLQTWEPLPSE